MRNLRIGKRLFILIAAQLTLLVLISATSYYGLRASTKALDNLQENTEQVAALTSRRKSIRDLPDLVNNMFRGAITWEKAEQQLPVVTNTIEQRWQKHLQTLSADERQRVNAVYAPAFASLGEGVEKLEQIIAERDREGLTSFVNNDMSKVAKPYLNQLMNDAKIMAEQANQRYHQEKNKANYLLLFVLVIAVLAIGVSALVGSAVYRSIADPIAHMLATIRRIIGGDLDVRTDMTGDDELAELGQAFDQLLQDRVAALVQAESENETLNESIIKLLQAVSQLSQRDLTVTVPVTEDMTGPVADALNLLTSETANVLSGVTRISEDVASASQKVKSQSDTVILVARNEREEVDKAAAELATAAEAMNHIAELAQACNEAADNAIRTTQKALETVTDTVDGINDTRDTIRETEKRIKRLGERSQEISGVVNIINTIAERTHILALNASMHAASAGEAGRGFAVVADEVQRLAENSREATRQIATLVSNIQTETADTVNAMNTAISQVVAGSQLAEQAGNQMRITQQTTAELVAAVQQISSSSQQQAQVSNQLIARAQQIQDSTYQTGQQLKEQTVYTENLVQFSQGLLSSVRVFKLPAKAN